MQGVILAGGKSSRMGTPKELLRVGGETLIERTARLVQEVTGTCMVISNHEDQLPRLPFSIEVYKDDKPGLGPLGGILTAMRYARGDHLLVVACDMPSLNAAVLKLLIKEAHNSDREVIVPVWNGKTHPLCAVYHRNLYPVVSRMLEDGKRRMFDLFSHVQVKEIDVSSRFKRDVFFNMNTPADYETIRKEETSP